MEFVRLLYVSKVTSSHPFLQEDLMDILDTAVDFNSRNGITGVLYYGHGYFVQCIEGSREKIETLFYHHILKDPRHQNCEILYYGQCEIGLFRHWNMKFAPINKRLTQFFIDHYRDDFNPYLLSSDIIPTFIELLASDYGLEPHNFELNE